MAPFSESIDRRKPKNIFVAGGTGVLGRRVVPRLVAGGHNVTALSRSDAKDAILREAGAEPVRVDLFDVDSLKRALAGHDAAVNLATKIPPPREAFKRRAWTENDRIRTRGADNLNAAALEAGATRFIQESITFTYAGCGEEWIDESAPLDPGWHTKSALEAEANALQLGEEGMVAVVLRFASFYAPDASHTQFQIDYADKGFAPIFGDPKDYFSMIHVDDAAQAVVASLDVPAGVYNVSEDQPLARGELLDFIADAAGRSSLWRMPNWLGKLVGGDVARTLMRSHRVSNKALRSASEWAPENESTRTGWPRLVERYRGGHRDA